MLASMHGWGTFLFFAGWCFVALVYVFVAVPETAGLSLEQLDALFEGPFWQMRTRANKQRVRIAVIDSHESGSVERIDQEFGRKKDGVEV